MGLHVVTWNDVFDVPAGMSIWRACAAAWRAGKPYFAFGKRINFCLGVDEWHDAGLWEHEVVGTRG